MTEFLSQNETLIASLFDLPLIELWHRSSKLFSDVIIDNFENMQHINSPEAVDSYINDSITVISCCSDRVITESLFSKNEDIDEYSTSALKFLFLDYFKAKLNCQRRDLRTRREYLIEAQQQLKEYLNTCKRLSLLHEEEIEVLETDESSFSTATRRSMKIAKYKRENAAVERMRILKDLIAAADIADEAGVEADNEEETRELTILQLQSYARDSIDSLNVLDQEIKILDHMHELRELDDEFINNGDNKDRKGYDIGLPGVASVPPKPGDGPGIEVTMTSKIGDEVVLTRQTVRAECFIPRMNRPTMTLAEFADIEVAQAIEREQKEAAAEGPVRKIKQIEADGDEEDLALVDLATTEDRNWDAWKEDNPRGWGNKMGKRF